MSGVMAELLIFMKPVPQNVDTDFVSIPVHGHRIAYQPMAVGLHFEKDRYTDDPGIFYGGFKKVLVTSQKKIGSSVERST